MISPIQFTPNMDMTTLTNALNTVFQQIESENRTKIIKDEDGTSRVIIGRSPKGEYLIAISAKGKDVLNALGS